MKTDKEYPATHSMSTSWYIVDDEGNVGIMEYNENGPVPWDVEDTDPNELKYGHREYVSGNGSKTEVIKFNLTDEQILDLLHSPHRPSEECSWYDCAVRIDKEKTERFLSLCKNPDIDQDYVFCISENLAIYTFDAFECVRDSDYNHVAAHGTLKTMLDEGIIIDVYNCQNLDTHDYLSEDYENIVHEKDFDNSPYYMFHQPYWSIFLPQKTHVPMHPVKISQIPKEFRHRLHKIPGKFKDMDYLQIAQYYPCFAYSNEDPIYNVDGCTYQAFPLPNGTKVYTLVNMFDFPFIDFCSEKKRFKCSDQCSNSCCDIYHLLHTQKPTVLIITDPREDMDYSWRAKTDVIFQNSFCTPYISKFPYKKGKNGWCSKHEMEKFITKDYLCKVFNGSKGYLELITKEINPRVILATDTSIDIIGTVYTTQSNRINIGGVEYPFYRLSTINENRALIENFATQPYQGKEHPLVITLEEMDSLVKQGRAK